MKSMESGQPEKDLHFHYQMVDNFNVPSLNHFPNILLGTIWYET